MKAVIIDDEKKQRSVVKHLLMEYCPQINVVGEAHNVESAFELIRSCNPQLVFLDVEMPDGSGFDLLAKFDKLNFGVVFVTAFDNYAIKAFEVNAIDYLLKPIDDRTLINAVNKATEKYNLENRLELYAAILKNIKQSSSSINQSQIIVKHVNGFDVIDIESINYINSDNKISYLVTTRKKVASTKPLSTFENVLSNYNNFMKVHKSYILNLNKLVSFKKVDGSGILVLDDGTEIPVSRRRIQTLMDFLRNKEV